ncbi:serine/arginine repetitive matrix protein 2 [Trichinella spiralis]|uniref:serine/arginine repetitive matrix protein 2 n=1 Tax=Trichinella spiralis TaxID=6334 RepID=UPI0001EFB6A8|nr:serine/arginine repetitive matrix protein 2 [Trichinella spiralis]
MPGNVRLRDHRKLRPNGNGRTRSGDADRRNRSRTRRGVDPEYRSEIGRRGRVELLRPRRPRRNLRPFQHADQRLFPRCRANRSADRRKRLAAYRRHRPMVVQRSVENHRPSEAHLQTQSGGIRGPGKDRKRLPALPCGWSDFRPRRQSPIVPGRCRCTPKRGTVGLGSEEEHHPTTTTDRPLVRSTLQKPSGQTIYTRRDEALCPIAWVEFIGTSEENSPFQ